MNRRTFATLLGLLLAASASAAGAQEELVYVKKESRDATRQASLAASGAIRWPITWQIIGPFDNTDGKGLDIAYPPGKRDQARRQV